MQVIQPEHRDASAITLYKLFVGIVSGTVNPSIAFIVSSIITISAEIIQLFADYSDIGRAPSTSAANI